MGRRTDKTGSSEAGSVDCFSVDGEGVTVNKQHIGNANNLQFPLLYRTFSGLNELAFSEEDSVV